MTIASAAMIGEPPDRRATVAIVGAGPAGLMAADVISQSALASVVVFDRMPSPGRKLLLAGLGGLNLTHGEALSGFLKRFGPAEVHVGPAIEAYDPAMLRAWCADLGIETFVGSSGRVFPTTFKTSPLLRAWLRRLETRGVRFALRHRWQGWDDDGALLFATAEASIAFAADAAVLALGGASWPQLGSDGRWIEILAELGIATEELQPANCGFAVSWSDVFRDRFEGMPLKNIAADFNGTRSRGDLVVTRTGLEGGAIYRLAPDLRSVIRRDGGATLHLALRPDLTQDLLVEKLSKRQPKQSLSTALRKSLKLSPVAIALLREAASQRRELVSEFDPAAIARLVNAVPIRLTAAMPIARAISSAGGVNWREVGPDFMLKRRPGTYVAGEMLDWEAPTGGYLLQACFATGAAAGHGVLARLAGPEQRKAKPAIPLATAAS